MGVFIFLLGGSQSVGVRRSNKRRPLIKRLLARRCQIRVGTTSLSLFLSQHHARKNVCLPFFFFSLNSPHFLHSLSFPNFPCCSLLFFVFPYGISFSMYSWADCEFWVCGWWRELGCHENLLRRRGRLHAAMDELPGSVGTSASLALRLGQAVFSSASLLFMCLDVEFYSYTAFWYSQIRITFNPFKSLFFLGSFCWIWFDPFVILFYTPCSWSLMANGLFRSLWVIILFLFLLIVSVFQFFGEIDRLMPCSWKGQ